MKFQFFLLLLIASVCFANEYPRCTAVTTRIRPIWRFFPNEFKENLVASIASTVHQRIPIIPEDLVSRFIRAALDPTEDPEKACETAYNMVREFFGPRAECIEECTDRVINVDEIVAILSRCRTNTACYQREIQTIVENAARCINNCFSKKKKDVSNCTAVTTRVRPIWRFLPNYIKENLIRTISTTVNSNIPKIPKRLVSDVLNAALDARQTPEAACKKAQDLIAEEFGSDGKCLEKCAEEVIDADEIIAIFSKCGTNTACYQREIERLVQDANECIDKCFEKKISTKISKKNEYPRCALITETIRPTWSLMPNFFRERLIQSIAKQLNINVPELPEKLIADFIRSALDPSVSSEEACHAAYNHIREHFGPDGPVVECLRECANSVIQLPEILAMFQKCRADIECYRVEIRPIARRAQICVDNCFKN